MSKFRHSASQLNNITMHSIINCLIILCMVISFASSTFAEIQIWNNTGTGTWESKKNWGPRNRSPLSTDDAQINNGGIAQVTAAGDVCANLYLGTNAATTGTLEIQTGGTLAVGTNAYIGNSGVGTVNQTGGTDTISGALGIGVNSGSSGTYTLAGGTLSVGGNITNGAGTGTLNINGGALTVSGTAIDVDNLNIGNAAATAGTWILGSGKNLTAGTLNVGNSGTGTFTQSGGTGTITNFYIGHNAGSSGTYSLNGGSLSVTNMSMGSGTATFTMGGGTMNVTGNLLFTSGGTFNRGTSNITFNGAGAQSITSGGKSFYDVTINKSSGTITTPDSFATTHDLTITNGTFTQSANTNSIGNIMTIGSGTYNLNGGMLSVIQIQNGAGTGTLNIDGGTFTLNGNTVDVDNFNIGNAAATTGSWTLGSGKSLTSGTMRVGNSGTGTLTQSGGTDTVATLYLGASAGGSGTYNLNSGVLSISQQIANGAGTGTLNIDGGSLTLNGNTIDVDNFNIGNAAATTGSWTLGAGKSLTAATETIGGSGTGTLIQAGGTNNVGTMNLGVSGYGTLTQTGGTATVTSNLYMATNPGSTGIYDVDGGRVNINGNITDGSGHSELNISAGTVNFNGTTATIDKIIVGDTASQSAIFNMGTNKTLTAGTLEVGTYGTGTFTQNGGTVAVTATDLYIGRYSGGSGTYKMNGGTLTGSVNMVIENNANAQGELKGYGDVDLTGSLTNNGRVIADGGNINTRDLVMSNFASIANTIENTSNNGWFAKNKGELILPQVYINTGTGTYNWGESPSDTEIDMVNSVQLEFTNVTTPGWLSIKLVAPGHEDAPKVYKPIGMWSITAPTLVYDGLDMAIRYDDSDVDPLTEDQLRMWHFLNDTWEEVMSTLDVTKNIIYVKDAVASGYYAVGKNTDIIPEPGSVVGIGLTIIGLIRRRLNKLLIGIGKKLIHR